jgi:hypothetical protein
MNEGWRRAVVCSGTDPLTRKPRYLRETVKTRRDGRRHPDASPTGTPAPDPSGSPTPWPSFEDGVRPVPVRPGSMLAGVSALDRSLAGCASSSCDSVGV